jgi:hypothetical protein
MTSGYLLTLGRHLLLVGCLSSLSLFGQDCDGPKQVREATLADILAFIQEKEMSVVTVSGYTTEGYENQQDLLENARKLLKLQDPTKVIINIRGADAGIGAMYAIAKEKGFITMGICSTLSRSEKASYSKCADYIFLVKDSQLGGKMPGTGKLSPTSEAIVQCSSMYVAFGGGEITRDELMTIVTERRTRILFVPAEMNHQIARENAKKMGLPEPADFRGPAFEAAHSDEAKK